MDSCTLASLDRSLLHHYPCPCSAILPEENLANGFVTLLPKRRIGAGKAHLDFLPNFADGVTGEAERLEQLDRGIVAQRNLAGEPIGGNRQCAVLFIDGRRSS